jgi:hypothetical protein
LTFKFLFVLFFYINVKNFFVVTNLFLVLKNKIFIQKYSFDIWTLENWPHFLSFLVSGGKNILLKLDFFFNYIMRKLVFCLYISNFFFF